VVDAIRLLQRPLFAEREECTDLSIFFLYARVVRLGERERGRLALLHAGARGVDGE